MEIHKIWPTIVYVGEFPFDTSELLEFVKVQEYSDTLTARSSASNEVLDAFPDIKTWILDEFTRFAEQELGFSSTKFGMFAHWGTKTEPNGVDRLHYHANSFYSGVLHLTEGSGGEFIMQDLRQKMFQPERCDTTQRFSPKVNQLLFFPSEVYHSIARNTSDQPRYSVAFNFIPVGKYGFDGSSIDIELKKPVNNL